VKSKLTIAGIALALSLGAYGWLHALPMTPQFSYSTESFLNQRGSMPPTTLFTPTADGNYQVSINVEFIGPCCSVNDGTSVTPTLTWSDNTKSYAGYVNGFDAPTDPRAVVPQNYNHPTVNMHVKAGSPVQISVNASSCNCSTGNDSYNLFVTVIGN
jgi:hypothetical protein